MCLMAPARVCATHGDSCDVEIGTGVDRVSSLATPDVEVGDWVLVNGGAVVKRLEPEQADEMSRAFASVFRSET